MKDAQFVCYGLCRDARVPGQQDDANLHVFEGAHRGGRTSSNFVVDRNGTGILPARGYMHLGAVSVLIVRYGNAERFEESAIARDDVLAANKSRDAASDLVSEAHGFFGYDSVFIGVAYDCLAKWVLGAAVGAGTRGPALACLHVHERETCLILQLGSSASPQGILWTEAWIT